MSILNQLREGCFTVGVLHVPPFPTSVLGGERSLEEIVAHCVKNARVLEAAGGAAVLLEKDSSGQALFQTACAILRDEARRKDMEAAMASLGIRDATERIYQTILEICR